jgi:NADPH:quinone reductase
VGQIAKLKGCRVIGIAGSDDKIKYILDELHFDAAINYKTTPDMAKAIADVAPNGVDIHFDNVGGEIADAVLQNINRYVLAVSILCCTLRTRTRFNQRILCRYRNHHSFGRIACCGAISTYNATSPPVGPRDEWSIITKSLKKQGFIVSQFMDDAPEFFQQMSAWVQSGQVKVCNVCYQCSQPAPPPLAASCHE